MYYCYINYTKLTFSTQTNKDKYSVEKSYSLENQSKMVKRPNHSHCILLIFRTANGKKSFTNWLQSLKNDQKTTNSIFQKQSNFRELYELFVYRLINLCSISIKLSGLIKFFHVKTTPFPLDIFTFSP